MTLSRMLVLAAITRRQLAVAFRRLPSPSVAFRSSLAAVGRGQDHFNGGF